MRNNKLRNKIIHAIKPNTKITKPLIIEGDFNKHDPKYGPFIEFALTLQERGLAKIKYQNIYPYKINGYWIWIEDRINNKWLKKFDRILCCNEVPNNPKCKPLIYFPKQYKNLLSLKNINYNIIHNVTWCGSNYRSKKRKNLYLTKYCDHSWIAGWLGTRKASKQIPMLSFPEYIRLLGSSRFCLCLPGFGPKCHREIEAMAVGSVPIFTPGCCTKYHNKLKEGVHYLIAENHQDIIKIKMITNSQWIKLSNNCKLWFDSNIAPEGAYKTILTATRRL